MSFTSARKLDVWRYWSDGQRTLAGTLAQNRDGVFFQYATDYLKHGSNLAPFSLHFDARVQPAPHTPHHGLHGVFADSLPDGWGLLLMDRAFLRAGIPRDPITAMDRLAFVGDTATGALTYEPASTFAHSTESSDTPPTLQQLGQAAQAVFDGDTEYLLSALIDAGSSGGARPKAQLYFADNDFSHCRTRPHQGDTAWLVKFTSAHLPLGHEEGLCEAAWLTLAAKAGITTATWRLLPTAGADETRQWLALKRFDRTSNQGTLPGRIHLLSAAALLDADFCLPSLDYSDLIKATSMLCKSPTAGKAIFRRAMFNLFGVNMDDHGKNWAFLQDDSSRWTPAPFYDVTFSPNPMGEHMTAYLGHGKNPPIKSVQGLAEAANFARWSDAQKVIQQVSDACSNFGEVATSLHLQPATQARIQARLNEAWQANRELLAKPPQAR